MRHHHAVAAAFALVGVMASATAQTREPSPPALPPEPQAELAWLPPTAVVVLEAPAPSAALQQLVTAAGGLPTGLPAEVAALVGAGLVAARVFLEGDFGEFLLRVADGGAAFGLLPDGAGWRWALALRPAEPAAAVAWLQRRVVAAEHRLVGAWLLVGSDAEVLESMQTAPTAVGERWWGPALADAGGAALRGAVDLAALRRAVPGRGAMMAGLDGPGRFLLAPIAHALDHATRLSLQLRATAPLQLQLQLDASIQDAAFGTLLPAGGAGRDLPCVGGEVLATLALDRSLHRLLREPATYLSPAGVTQVDSFLSIADGFDGPNSSIVDELFGRLGEPATLFVLAPAEPADPRPPLLLPDFAVCVPVADARVEGVVRRVIDLFGIVVNAERMQRRQAPLLLRGWRGEHGTGLVVEMPEWRGPGAPPLENSLSPVMAFGHEHMVLASTETAAERVLAACAASAREHVNGDLLRLSGPAIADALARSRDALVLARMLDEGEDHAAAARFFAIVDAVLRSVRQVQFVVTPTPARTIVTVEAVRSR